MVDAIVCDLYGVHYEMFAAILKDCDRPISHLSEKKITEELNPKGFWRLGKILPLPNRPTIAAFLAYRDLYQLLEISSSSQEALSQFVGRNPEDGWHPPEILDIENLQEASNGRLGRFIYDEYEISLLNVPPDNREIPKAILPQTWEENELYAQTLKESLTIR